MAALEQFSPTAQAVIKVFAYPFRSAPTADLVSWGVATLQAGTPPAAWLNTLLALPVPQSPFTAYAPGTSNTAFCTALVDNLTFATSTADAVKAAWVTALLPMLASAPSRGDFIVQVALLIEGYAGSDAALLALKAGLAERAEKAAVFALSPQGAVYDGQGFAQLLAPLTPVPPPSYELSASASAVDEGQLLSFTLQTAHVDPGTVIDYTLEGVSAADVVGGALSGRLTVDVNGRATVPVTLVADRRTEGNETLTLKLAGNLAQASVTVRDTSQDPPPDPTYALSASLSSVDEGASITFTLATTNLAAGTVVPYTLSGVSAADITGGQLTGTLVLGADGRATVAVSLVADAATEGTELLRFRLDGQTSQVEVLVNDTSLTPPPPATKDTILVADVLANSQARVPANPTEGEIERDTWLTYDLLDQSLAVPRRMSVLDLRSSGTVAGAPLNTTNHSAERGNLPQVSNQHLVTYDLGLETDRVDYSVERGTVAALLGRAAPTETAYILVNDDATDTVYNNATDRIDTLVSVEEVVASAGGGLIDLTASGRDWLLTFSRGWDVTPEVASTRDREIHRLQLSNPDTGTVHPVTYIEFRDAGLSPDITQAPALWTTVQGSDHDETLVFSAAESLDQRLNVLRGGDNAVKYSSLVRSIVVDLAITPWATSTALADDGNSTGVLTATTRFTNGDGSTLLSAASHVTQSYLPDNGVSAGTLSLTGTLDAEDALNLSGVTSSKVVSMGLTSGGIDTVQLRLATGPSTSALVATGFEIVVDNGATDDLVFVGNIVSATRGTARLRDGAGGDHDAVSIGDTALGSAAVGGTAGLVNLNSLNNPTVGFDFDFDVLDLSRITSPTSATGTAALDDELVVGPLSTLLSVSAFEALVLTSASLAAGAAFTFNLDTGSVRVGSTSVGFTGTALSAGGAMFNTPGQTGPFAALDTGISITTVDITPGAGATLWGGNLTDLLTGGAGDDVLRGGRGDDVLSGGSTAETWSVSLFGVPDVDPAHRLTITLTVDGTALTLTEAAVADTSYGDGNGAVPDGVSPLTIGNALAALVNANIGTINTGPGIGQLSRADFDNATGTLTLRYVGGIDATDVVSVAVAAAGDTGNLSFSALTNTAGGNGGADRFVFERTGALNGSDQINDFSAATDRLDMTAFINGSITSAAVPIDAVAGGLLGGLPARLERVFNKSTGLLSTSDFATVTSAGKFVLPDNTRVVLVVTADPTGNRGDAANTPMRVYLVDNGSATGLSDLTVSLVGVVNNPNVELTLAEMAGAFS